MFDKKNRAAQFWNIFSDHWQNVTDGDKKNWHEDALWTRFMLGDSPANTDAKGGLLVDCVEAHLRFLAPETDRTDRLIRCEWSKIDLAGLTRYGEEKTWYKTSLQVIVEHENRVDTVYDLESEFYKLLHWRAPLKVLVCYHKPDETRDRRYRDKQVLFSRMYKEALFLMGVDAAEYLMIVGGRRNEDIGFCAFELKAGEWKELL